MDLRFGVRSSDSGHEINQRAQWRLVPRSELMQRSNVGAVEVRRADGVDRRLAACRVYCFNL